MLPHEDIELEKEVIYNTHFSSGYFHRDEMVGSELNLRFYNAFPNILTGLGILGTFFGLVCGIYLSSSGLASDDIQEAKAALSNLLDGAAFAFTTSIAGLLSSILFSWREKAWVHKLETLVGDWVESLDARVQRMPAEKLQAHTLQESKQQTRLLTSFSNDLALSIASALESKVQEPIAESLDRLIETVEAMRQDRRETDSDALGELIGGFSESISGAAGEEMKAFASTLNQMNDVFGTQMETLSTNQQELVEVMSQGVQSLNSCVTNIAELNENTHSMLLDSNALVQRISHIQQGLTTTAESIGSSADAFTSASASTQEASSLISRSTSQLVEVADRLEGTHAQITQSWQDYQERFESVDESLAEAFKGIDQGLGRYSQSIKDFVLEIEKQTAGVVENLSGATKELSDAIEEMTGSLQERR